RAGRTAKLVIEGGYMQLKAKPVAKLDQRMEQRQRVWTAGNGNDPAIAGLNRDAVMDGPFKSGEQHATVINPLTHGGKPPHPYLSAVGKGLPACYNAARFNADRSSVC